MYGSMFPFHRIGIEGDAPRSPARTRRRKSTKGSRKRRPAGPPTRPRLRPEQVELLAAALIVRPRAAKTAACELKPAFFSSEPHLEVLWEVLLGVFPVHGFGRTPCDALRAAVAARLEAASPPLPAEAGAALLAAPDADIGPGLERGANGATWRPGVIYRAFHELRTVGPSSLSGFRLLGRFLYERGVIDESRRLAARSIEAIPGDFDSRFDEIRHRLERLKWLGGPIVYTLADHPPPGL
ncbi:hypothetical protein [Paludisphaera mucosa]|uniref:DNA helicase DnaB-like N-terminal domain-containing protein n=1 Tax=Paludisphaera mucosa TaxID=3030827 RepID=A0ABT6FCT3_9BACT|nr:hypothetical protein [Paludisphaera mucosa]MDG3005386.1 hypothetical protein [Paludisphaera mucosa]